MTDPVDTDLHVMQPPPPPAGWMILDDGPYFTRWAVSSWPNAWYRFWMKLLLGWRFEKYEETDVPPSGLRH